MSSLYNFLRRHRRKLAWGGAAIGGAVLVSTLIDRHLTKAREEEGKQALESIRLRNYYEMTECTYNSTFSHLFNQLTTKIVEIFDADSITSALREKPGGDEKLRLWNEMKLVCFCKTSAFVICQTFLGVLVRVQLNILAGYMFSERVSVNSLLDYNRRGPNHPRTSISTQGRFSSALQEKYLNIAHFFISEGFVEFCELLMANVKKIVETVRLQDPLKLEDLERIFQNLLESIFTEGYDDNLLLNPGRFILSNKSDSANDLRNMREDDKATFKTILTETLEIMESQEVVSLIKRTSRQGFAFCTDNLADLFIDANQNPESDEAENAQRFISPCNIRLPLARLLPAISGFADSGKKEDGERDQWLSHLIECSDVKLLGANIYETFCEKERNRKAEQDGWVEFLQTSVTNIFK